MTAMSMYSANMMSYQASAGSMDASASHTHCACARAAFRTIANVLDAMILASIFVMISLIIISLVILGGLVNSLVLAVLIQLAAALIFRRITRKS
nr:hypothetical protein [uncultured Oscillibacter sp.]